MCEKMEELVMEPRPLDTTGGWEKQVNGHHAKKVADGQKKISWAEQQKANRRAEKRANRAMNAVALGLALIVAGGVYLNYVDGFPIWVAASVSVCGMAIFSFVIGWICGHRCRR